MKKLVELAFFVDDVEANANFYRGLLGVEPVAQSEGMAILMSGDTKIFIHKKYTPGEGELPPENHLAFTVEDIDGECKNLTNQGIEIEVEPKDYYWGRSAYLRAPDGQLIELIQEPKKTEGCA
ncbi:MAG: VOC family protein [Anaerolineales bacterium]|nr:VOC family protein [Chloroflexota bacterium]MBL6980878.1 VOC family protein [Anaerolineales bacterium]